MTSSENLAILTGEAVDVETLRAGFNRGFADYRYNMRQDAAAMPAYLRRANIAPEDCAVLVAKKEGRLHAVGAALLAVRGSEGWCGGLCVAPPYRGSGWGTRLMKQIKRRAVERGVQRVLLEVLVSNDHARSVYREAGFKTVRELLLWERDPRQGPLPLPYETLQQADPAQILQDLYHWHTLPLTWARRAGSLLRFVEQNDCVGFTIPARDGAPVAYAVAALPTRTGLRAEAEQPPKLRILDLAADPDADILDAGRPLLQALQLRYVDARLTLTDQPADSRFSPILAAFGFRVFDRQYELALDLSAGTLRS